MYRAIQALGGHRNYIHIVYPPGRTRRRGDGGTALLRACLGLHDRPPLHWISVTPACHAPRWTLAGGVPPYTVPPVSLRASRSFLISLHAIRSHFRAECAFEQYAYDVLISVGHCVLLAARPGSAAYWPCP